MRLLLDTHVLLALLDERYDRFPQQFRDVLSSRSSVTLVSAASLWEIAIKSRLGRLPLSTSLASLPGQIHALGAGFLDVTVDHVLHEVSPWPDTKDPFDRLLIATAALERARLVTLDVALLAHPLAWHPASA